MDNFLNIKDCKDCTIKLPIFDSLTDEQLEMVDKTRYEVKFKPGEVIFKQGSALTHIAIITKGFIKIYLEGFNNRNLILRFSKPVTMIGSPGLFTDSRHHSTTIAVDETIACFIDINTYSKIIEENKEFTIGLLRYINVITINTFKKTLELTQKGMHGRISSALLYLNNEVFKNPNCEVKISRQDLADLTAMTKESAIRILKDFKDEKTITIDGNSIILNDLKNLNVISEKG